MKSLFRKVLPLRNRYVLAIDFFGILAMPSVAFLLRTESLEQYQQLLVPIAVLTSVMTVLKLAIYSRMGMYAHFWPYAGISEVLGMLRATTLAALLETAISGLILIPTGVIPPGFPRTVPFLDALFSMVFVIGFRVGISLMFKVTSARGTPVNQKSVLIIGAGEAGIMLVREMLRNPEIGLNPIGYIDDDPRKHGKRINGIKVIGSMANLPRILEKTTVEEVVIAIPSAPGSVVREVVQACKASGIPSRTIPGLFDILRGTAKVEQFRSVQLEDLLRRGIIRADSKAVRDVLTGARVLVTGAGGSIGSEMCRQIMDFNPFELVLLGHGENSIYQILGELQQFSGKQTRVVPVVADIRDRDRMQNVFERHRPDIVFHAAAHKHLPLMEENIEDAITNNVVGTSILVDLTIAWNVERFVLISTDKAVNPTSVLGVTKRIAELIVRDAGRQTAKKFVAVRFGNVLGSRGSVIPLFERQIRSGGPITVADRDVRRFFMTIPEAVQLVLQSASMGTGSEVFVLDMGEQIKIADLVRDLLRLNGLKEGKDIEIVFTGLKPGEKMREELFFRNEHVERTSHDKILVCRNGLPKPGMSENQVSLGPGQAMDALVAATKEGNREEMFSNLKRLVPEYVPAFAAQEGLFADERGHTIPAEVLSGMSLSRRGFSGPPL